MADVLRKDVDLNQKLRGKTNFRTWKHAFHRAAQVIGVLDLFTGEEREGLAKEPVPEDHIRYIAAKSTESSEKPRTIDTELSLFHFKCAMDLYERHKKRTSLAMELFDHWLSPLIRSQIREFVNPVLAYRHIVKTYGPSLPQHSATLLDEAASLKLKDHENMTDFLTAHQNLRDELTELRYDYPHEQIIANIFNGLPGTYRVFKVKHRWGAVTNGREAFDLEGLFEALLIEEEAQQKSLNRPVPVTPLMTTKLQNTTVKHVSPAKTNNKTPPEGYRTVPVCTFCFRQWHIAGQCWFAHPELRPKDKRPKKASVSGNTSRNTSPNKSKEWSTANRSETSTSSSSQDDDKNGNSVKHNDSKGAPRKQGVENIKYVFGEAIEYHKNKGMGDLITFSDGE